MTSKLASLHSGLVARKGEAMPAVSHPLFSYVDTPPRSVMREESVMERLERRGWPNAAARPGPAATPHPESENPVARPSPVSPTVEHAAQQDSRFIAANTAVPHVHRKSDDSDPATRHRFTFRMTNEQHHRLRLAAAVRDESLQHILSLALDNHLEGLCACSLKDCACLAAAQAARS